MAAVDGATARPCVWPAHRETAPHDAESCKPERTLCQACSRDVVPHVESRCSPRHRDPALVRRAMELEWRRELSELSDGHLGMLLVRLRRREAMADEDELPAWARESLSVEAEAARAEWAWRRRAEARGGPEVVRGRWRERVEAVKRAVDLGALIRADLPPTWHLVGFEGRGQWMVNCPFHADSDPSMSVDAERGLFYCFGCDVGGDCFTYVELRDGVGFGEAVRQLEGWAA